MPHTTEQRTVIDGTVTVLIFRSEHKLHITIAPPMGVNEDVAILEHVIEADSIQLDINLPQCEMAMAWDRPIEEEGASKVDPNIQPA